MSARVSWRRIMSSCRATNAKRSHSNQPYKGVRKMGSRWEARISSFGKCQHLGMFATAEAARDAYKQQQKQSTEKTHDGRNDQTARRIDRLRVGETGCGRGSIGASSGGKGTTLSFGVHCAGP